MQVLSVTMAIGGIVLFAYTEGFQSANLIGVILSVGAAVGAALYKVSLMSLFACYSRIFHCKCKLGSLPATRENLVVTLTLAGLHVAAELKGHTAMSPKYTLLEI